MSSKYSGEDFALGAIAYVIILVVFCFFPSMMVSLSIVDTLFDWVEVEVTKIPIRGNINNQQDITGYEDHNIYHYDDKVFAQACFWFCVFFIIIGFIQVGLMSNIKHTWGIIVPWYLLSIYPFIKWLEWIYSDTPFNGIDWMPW